MLKILTHKEAVDFLLPRHYSGRKPQIKWAFGWIENEVLTCVLTIGKPASDSLCKGICGELYSDKVYELNRLCVDGSMSIPLSRFVSSCLKQLPDLIIVSYADTDMGHVGYIYQATNWLYTGQTKARTDKYTEGNKHSRHYEKSNNNLRKLRSSKHRYVLFTGSKSFKTETKSSLKYTILPYPKGESRKYRLGDFLKSKIINKYSNR